MQGLSCFWVIIPNREVKFICLPCLVLLALLFFSLFCLLSGGQQIFSGDYFILVKYFSFFAFRVLYRIIPVSHHISGKHLLLCLSVLISESYSTVRVTVNIEVDPCTPIESKSKTQMNGVCFVPLYVSVKRCIALVTATYNILRSISE